MSDRTLLFFDLDRTLWDFERNSLETLKGLFAELDLAGRGVPDFDTFNGVYQRENAACWKAYQAGTMTKPILRGERFRRTLAVLGSRTRSWRRRWGPSMWPGVRTSGTSSMGPWRFWPN